MCARLGKHLAKRCIKYMHKCCSIQQITCHKIKPGMNIQRAQLVIEEITCLKMTLWSLPLIRSAKTGMDASSTLWNTNFTKASMFHAHAIVSIRVLILDAQNLQGGTVRRLDDNQVAICMTKGGYSPQHNAKLTCVERNAASWGQIPSSLFVTRLK